MRRTNNLHGPDCEYDQIDFREGERDAARARALRVPRPARISHVSLHSIESDMSVEKVAPPQRR